MKERLVIALGGNALGNTPKEQLQLVKQTAKSIVDLVEEGYEVVIGHGNGPQVGMINQAMEEASLSEVHTPSMPFPECGAMSQGYIGYHLQQAIQEELKKRKIQKNCVTLISQVVVDEKDEAFLHPTKPIGRFVSKEEADSIQQEKGYVFMEDAGRGYRRVIASPMPKEIVEINVVKQLVEAGNIVITVGGGGIPVIETEEGYQGVAAVIDKDKSSSLLAQNISADKLVILTAVEQVYIHFNTPNEKALSSMTIEEAKEYLAEGHFAPGSMKPKVEACIDFVENHSSGGKAIITSLDQAKNALKGQTGTIITK